MSTGSGSKRVVVLQPSYLPWLGYFDQLYKSDIFVLYDDVQYDKHGWRNRNRIKTDKGSLWLTVPVLTHGQGLPINRDARIDTRQPWARKHLQALRVNYAKAPAFGEVFDALEPVLGRPWTHLIDLNRAVLEALCRPRGPRSIPLAPSWMRLWPEDRAAHRPLPGPRRGPVSDRGCRERLSRRDAIRRQRHPRRVSSLPASCVRPAPRGVRAVSVRGGPAHEPWTGEPGSAGRRGRSDR